MLVWIRKRKLPFAKPCTHKTLLHKEHLIQVSVTDRNNARQQ